jgi:hypothetical protein
MTELQPLQEITVETFATKQSKRAVLLAGFQFRRDSLEPAAEPVEKFTVGEGFIGL